MPKLNLFHATKVQWSKSLITRKRAITAPILALHIALLVAISIGYAPRASAQTCPFDDGNSSLEVEGLILTRYALGITGAPLVASTNINVVDAPTVEAAINCPSCGLNITGNPTMTVADATIISRKLAGFSGAALTNNLALGSGTRNTPAAVQSFLLAGCGATSVLFNPFASTLTTVDSAGDVGQYTSITLGADGLPVISYFDSTNGDLKVAKCNSPTCSHYSPTATTVDRVGSVGQYTSITLGADGLPVISYYDVTNGDLKVAKCTSATCVPFVRRR